MDQCFECGATECLHNHHVVPRSRGGTATVPLCEVCHAKAHHRDRRMTTSRLTAEAMARKAAKGEYTGGPAPYGWQVAADGVHLEPNPAEQAVIRAARKRRAASLSLRKVGAMLADQGLLPRTGKSWHPEKVKAALAARVA